MYYDAFGGGTFPPPVYRGDTSAWSSVAAVELPGQTHRLVRHVTSPAALCIVAVGLLYAHHVRSSRLRYVDVMIARCSAVVRDGDDPDVHKVEWAESGNSGDAAAAATEADRPPASALGKLGLTACAAKDGIAVRTVPALGTAVVVCDSGARKAAVLVDRRTRGPASTTSDEDLRARLLGRVVGV